VVRQQPHPRPLARHLAARGLWAEFIGARTAQQSAVVYRGRVKAVPKDSLVVGDPGAHSLFDDRVYKRGALALHAIRTEVGDAAFFDALRAWVAEYRHGSVSSERFVTFFEDHTGNDEIGLIVERWIYSASLPEVTR
jgi:aminopeptidase N